MINTLLMDVLIKEMDRAIPQDARCPNLKKDNLGFYCAKDMKEEKSINEERWLVCDSYTLQAWCLNKDSAPKCASYKGEPLSQRIN